MIKSWSAILPIILAVIYSSYTSYNSIKTTISELTAISEFTSQSIDIPPLLAIQERATVFMVMDPETLEEVSIKKIDAYDKTLKILDEIIKISPDENINRIISNIKTIDEKKVKPIETKILEKLYGGELVAKKLYLTQYQEVRGELAEQFNLLLSSLNELANKRKSEILNANMETMWINVAILFLSILVVMAVLFILSLKVLKSEQELYFLLESISEGLFFFNKTGTISKKRSSKLVALLPGSSEAITIQGLFETFIEGFPKDKVKSVLSLLWPSKDEDFFSSFEDSCSLLPQRITVNNGNRVSVLQLRYQPIYIKKDSENYLDKVVVGIEDVTESLELKRTQEQQLKRIDRIHKATSNVEAFKEFLKEAIVLFKKIDKCMKDENQCFELDRDLHTLKGNLGMYGFVEIASKIHKIEDTAAKAQCHDCHKLWEVVKDQWKFESSDVEEMTGLRSFEGKVITTREKVQRLKTSAAAYPELSKNVEALERHPVHEVFQKYVDLIERLSRQTPGKSAKVVFDVTSDEVLFSEINQVDNGLIHIIRNSFDHGIETEEERVEKNKHKTGQINIACFRKSDGTLHLTIRDDGKGIDAERLCNLAIEKGLITQEEANAMSYQDKMNLIFKDSLSGKEKVTDLSGRGVGMSAVKALIIEIGGSITVFSHLGLGTQIEIEMPFLR